MKKFTLKSLALMLVCIMVIPMMFACNNEEKPETDPFLELTEEEKAFYILNDETYDNQPTYIELTQEIACSYMGFDLSVSATGKETSINKDSDAYVHYLDLTTSTSIMGTTTTVVSKSGYTDGKMFAYTEIGGEGQGAWSPISKNDYIAYNDTKNGTFNSSLVEIKKEDCQSITCVQNEDNNWVATFTNISGESMNYFKTLLDATEGMLDPEQLESVTLTLIVDSTRKPMSIAIDFNFIKDSGLSFTIDGNITIGDTVEAPSVDLTDYIEVEDLREVEL